jgi:hypothetical protein
MGVGRDDAMARVTSGMRNTGVESILMIVRNRRSWPQFIWEADKRLVTLMMILRRDMRLASKIKHERLKVHVRGDLDHLGNDKR